MQKFGGVAGNAISVKLGTVTPEGGSGSFFALSIPLCAIDIYCDSKRDPELPVHLASFGINIQNLLHKSQIEHNDFSLTDHDGSQCLDQD